MEETKREVRLDWIYSLDGKRSLVELPVFGEVELYVYRYSGGTTTAYFESDALHSILYSSGFEFKYRKGMSDRETLIQEQIRLEDHLREWLPQAIKEVKECLEKLNG